MNAFQLINEPWFTYGVLPLLIVCARVTDVSIGTMRIIFVAKGHKMLAPLLGFFEVIIWLLAIGQIMQNLSNWACYLAYGTGFALGNFVGMLIEEKVAAGLVAIRVITQKEALPLTEALRTQGYGVTALEGHGGEGDVNVLYVVIRRKHLPRVVEMINRFNPKAFYSVEEVRAVSGGVYPSATTAPQPWSALSWPRRKGK